MEVVKAILYEDLARRLSLLFLYTRGFNVTPGISSGRYNKKENSRIFRAQSAFTSECRVTIPTSLPLSITGMAL